MSAGGGAGSTAKREFVRARSRSRRLAMQGLYQWQLTGQPVQDILAQLRSNDEAAQVDDEYFAMLLKTGIAAHEEFDVLIADASDRLPTGLDPVERAILWCGLVELTRVVDVPYRVAINEAVELARRFGAEDGHKFVNAVLDRVAREQRDGGA